MRLNILHIAVGESNTPPSIFPFSESVQMNTASIPLPLALSIKPRDFDPRAFFARVILFVSALWLPSAVKRGVLLALFTAGTLAGAWGAELRTNDGRDHQSRTSYDTASNATGIYAALNYIALTESSTAPAAGDTTLSGELTTQGLGRAQAAYAHTNGTNTVVLTKTFTITAAPTRTPAKAGLLNAAAVGDLGYSTLIPDPPPLAFSSGTGDSMAATWTFTL